MGPPTCASGATCPTQKPWLPPEKRPSVMSATSCPKSIGNWCVSGGGLSPNGAAWCFFTTLRLTHTDLPQPGAHDDCRGVEHLLHARPALGPLVPDDYDAALELGRIRRDRRHHVLLLVEAARGADELGALLARDLAYGELGRQVALQLKEVARK